MIGLILSTVPILAQNDSISRLQQALGLGTPVAVKSGAHATHAFWRSNYIGLTPTVAPDGRVVYYPASDRITGLRLNADGPNQRGPKTVFDDDIAFLYVSQKPLSIRVGTHAQFIRRPVPRVLESMGVYILGMASPNKLIVGAAGTLALDHRKYIHVGVIDLDAKYVSENRVARRSAAPLEWLQRATSPRPNQILFGTTNWTSRARVKNRFYELDKKSRIKLEKQVVIDATKLGQQRLTSWMDVAGRRIVIAGDKWTLIWSGGKTERVPSPVPGIIHAFLFGNRIVWVTTASGEPDAPGSPCSTFVQDLGGTRQEMPYTYILAHSENGKHLLVENATNRSVWLLSRD